MWKTSAKEYHAKYMQAVKLLNYFSPLTTYIYRWHQGIKKLTGLTEAPLCVLSMQIYAQIERKNNEMFLSRLSCVCMLQRASDMAEQQEVRFLFVILLSAFNLD